MDVSQKFGLRTFSLPATINADAFAVIEVKGCDVEGIGEGVFAFDLDISADSTADASTTIAANM